MDKPKKMQRAKKTKLNKEDSKLKWYTLIGFNVDDDTQTGFLAIDRSRSKNCYKIVKDKKDALKFPSKNIYGVDSFGTPKQWLEFFKGEDELSSWKFHLSCIKGPSINKAQEI